MYVRGTASTVLTVCVHDSCVPIQRCILQILLPMKGTPFLAATAEPKNSLKKDNLVYGTFPVFASQRTTPVA